MGESVPLGRREEYVHRRGGIISANEKLSAKLLFFIEYIFLSYDFFHK
jgi:hypothetical protein